MRGIMFSFSMIERSHGYRYSIIIDITTNIQPKISNSFIDSLTYDLNKWLTTYIDSID